MLYTRTMLRGFRMLILCGAVCALALPAAAAPHVNEGTVTQPGVQMIAPATANGANVASHLVFDNLASLNGSAPTPAALAAAFNVSPDGPALQYTVTDGPPWKWIRAAAPP